MSKIPDSSKSKGFFSVICAAAILISGAGCAATLDKSTPGGQLYEIRDALERALPAGMVITRAETREMEGVRSFIIHAGNRDRSRAHPGFAVCLWPTTPGKECPFHKQAGTHTFTYAGNTEEYEIYYSGPENFRGLVLRVFSTGK